MFSKCFWGHKWSKWNTNMRHWLIGFLFTEDEKFLLKRAVDERIYNIEHIMVNEEWADKDDIKKDILDYCNLNKIFKTILWS